MGWTFALANRDPNLLGCVLEALGPLAPQAPSAYGLATYAGGEPLLELQPSVSGPLDLRRLARDVQSEVMLAALTGPGSSTSEASTQPLSNNRSAPSLPRQPGWAQRQAGGDGSTGLQPFRFRRFVFAHVGEVLGFVDARPALMRALPEFWRGQLQGGSASELCFMFVLRRLRELTAGDDDSSAAQLAQALRAGLTDFESARRDAGSTRPAALCCTLTDGRSVAVSRMAGPCALRMFEGLVPCARCGIDEKTPEMHPALRPHRRLRAVALVSQEGLAGFAPLPERSVTSVSAELELRTEAF